MPQKKTCIMSMVVSLTTSRSKCSEAKCAEKMPVFVLTILQLETEDSARSSCTVAMTPCDMQKGWGQEKGAGGGGRVRLNLV